MQLLQQLIAAELNASAFRSTKRRIVRPGRALRHGRKLIKTAATTASFSTAVTARLRRRRRRTARRQGHREHPFWDVIITVGSGE